MKLALNLVRGHEIDGENQDLFVVAASPDRARDLWNDYCIEQGWARHDGDDETQLPRGTTTDPALIREILPDVAGTIYAGGERVVDWDEMKVVA